MIASTIIGNYDRSQGGGMNMASKLAQVRPERERERDPLLPSFLHVRMCIYKHQHNIEWGGRRVYCI